MEAYFTVNGRDFDELERYSAALTQHPSFVRLTGEFLPLVPSDPYISSMGTMPDFTRTPWPGLIDEQTLSLVEVEQLLEELVTPPTRMPSLDDTPMDVLTEPPPSADELDWPTRDRLNEAIDTLTDLALRPWYRKVPHWMALYLTGEYLGMQPGSDLYSIESRLVDSHEKQRYFTESLELVLRVRTGINHTVEVAGCMARSYLATRYVSVTIRRVRRNRRRSR